MFKSLATVLSQSFARLSGLALSDEIAAGIQKMVKGQTANVVLFMKGSPSQPMCGFSKAIVDLLNIYKVPFEHHDILSDESLRSNMKVFSDWPTFPQIYINGQFQGGYDIFMSMERENKLGELLKEMSVIDENGNPIYKTKEN